MMDRDLTYKNFSCASVFRVLLIFCVFGLSPQLLALNQISGDLTATKQVSGAAATAQHHFVDSNTHHSDHHPSVPGSYPAEQIPVSESESDVDEESGKLLLGLVSIPKEDLSQIQTGLFEHSRLFIWNHSQVSRIIMFHCWKSFIA